MGYCVFRGEGLTNMGFLWGGYLIAYGQRYCGKRRWVGETVSVGIYCDEVLYRREVERMHTVAVERRVRRLGGRGGTMVLTRCCMEPRIRRVTSCMKSSFCLDGITINLGRGAVMFYNISFVNRDTGVLGPRGAILVPSVTTSYPVTRVTSTRAVRGVHSRCSSLTIIYCVGSATRLGERSSIYMASSGTIGVMGTLPGGGVFFVPSHGLTRCVTKLMPRGGFVCGRKFYVIRRCVRIRRVGTTGTTRPRTRILSRPRYPTGILRLSSFIKDASRVVTRTKGSSTGRFVVYARDKILCRLRGEGPRGGFCFARAAPVYEGVGGIALRGILRMLGANGGRMFMSSGLHRRSGGPLREVLRLTGWARNE